MTQTLWLNLSVKNLGKAKIFYSALGFTFESLHDNNTMLAMTVGVTKVPVMLFQEEHFAHVLQQEVTDTANSSEILISIDAESKEEVDEMADKVKAAGGKVFFPPTEIQGGMYNCAFSDIDGHRWNVLHLEKN